MTEQPNPQQTHAHRELFADVLLSEAAAIVAPLMQLDERTRASIVALVGAAQLVTAYHRSNAIPNDRIGPDFDGILAALHPEATSLVGKLRSSGLPESIAYTWMLALSEIEPTRMNAAKTSRAASDEMASAMQGLDALVAAVRRLQLPATVASDRPPRRV